MSNSYDIFRDETLTDSTLHFQEGKTEYTPQQSSSRQPSPVRTQKPASVPARKSSVVRSFSDLDLADAMEIVDENIRKTYLTRLSDMEAVPIENLPALEDDIISSIRLYEVEEMVYQKGQPVPDVFMTVFSALASFPVTIFIVMDSDGQKTRFYLGVRSNEPYDQDARRSAVSLGDTLRQSLTGHFPGAKLKQTDRKKTADLSMKILEAENAASISIAASLHSQKDREGSTFVQGLEKMVLAMNGRPFTGIILAENQAPEAPALLRTYLQETYTQWSPLRKAQFSENKSEGDSRQASFSEMS